MAASLAAETVGVGDRSNAVVTASSEGAPLLGVWDFVIAFVPFVAGIVEAAAVQVFSSGEREGEGGLAIMPKTSRMMETISSDSTVTGDEQS